MIQGLMTVEVVTSYIKTPSDNSAVIASMGLANLVSGFLGGMGGDAPGRGGGGVPAEDASASAIASRQPELAWTDRPE